MPAWCPSWWMRHKSNSTAVYWHLYAYPAMLVFVMVPRCCSWIGLFNCFYFLAVCIAFFGTMKAILEGTRFQVRLAWVVWVLYPMCAASSAVGPSPREETKCFIGNLHCFGSHLDHLDQLFNRRFPVSSTGVLVSLWFRGEHCQPKWLNFLLYMYTSVYDTYMYVLYPILGKHKIMWFLEA